MDSGSLCNQTPIYLCRYVFLSPGGHCPSLPVHLWRWLHNLLWRWRTSHKCHGLRWQHLYQVRIMGTLTYKEDSIHLQMFKCQCLYRCVAVLGDLIPVRGRHYWEVEVDDGTEFRIGVAYEDTERNSYLGANSTSWCMRHILSPSR